MTELVPRATDVPNDFRAVMHMAEVLSGSDLLPTALRRKPANVLLVLCGARALRVPAFWALQSMHVIEGKLTMSAELMRALVLRAGHRFTVLERTVQRAVVEIHRKDRDKPYRAEFTINDAKTAELLGKGNWKKYPAAMLVARATGIAVRDECPDELFGVAYTPDELGAVTNEDGEPLEGEVVAVRDATRDAIGEVASTLVKATLEEFPAAWQVIIDLGWTGMKMDDDGITMADYAADLLAAHGLAATDVDGVKAVWTVAGSCNLLNHQSPTATKKLGALLVAYGEQHKTVAKAKIKNLQDEAAAAAEDERLKAEQEYERIKAEQIDTENAQKLREAAGKSWGDTEEVVTGEIVEAADRE